MSGILALFYREMKIWVRRPLVPFLSLMQPLLYLLIFGPVLGRMMPPVKVGEVYVEYSVFILPGILTIFILNTCIMSSLISLFLDRRTGMIEFLMACPVSKSAYLLARFIASIIQVILQTTFLLLLSHVILRFPLSLIGILTFFTGVVLGTIFFLSVTMIIATKITDQDIFNALISFFVPILIFTSTAFYPIDLFPDLLAAVARINPLVYIVDFLRAGLLNTFTDTTILTTLFFKIITLLTRIVSIILFSRQKALS
ncbi:MAG: ABC transporter permease [Thermoproteota archaeon]